MALSVSAVLANSFGGRLFDKREAEPTALAQSSTNEAETMQKTTRLSVPSIHCQGCVDTITAGLSLTPGIAGVNGDPDAKMLLVTYDPGKITPDKLSEAVRRLGHKVEGEVTP